MKTIDPSKMDVVRKATYVKVRRRLTCIFAIICMASSDPRDDCVKNAIVSDTGGAETFAIY